jgi:hypothetical protein
MTSDSRPLLAAMPGNLTPPFQSSDFLAAVVVRSGESPDRKASGLDYRCGIVRDGSARPKAQTSKPSRPEIGDKPDSRQHRL